MTDTYNAGRAAGIREAAELCACGPNLADRSRLVQTEWVLMSNEILALLDAPATAVCEAREAGIREALQAIADLPTGRNEDVMEGQEQSYRAVEALLDAPAPAGVRIKPLNDWLPVANADFRNWGPWIWHGEKSQRPAHIRVSLNNEEGTDVAIYLTENGSGWGRNYSPDWSEITWYRLRNNHPYYMAALEPAPAGVTAPDELYQAAKRDAEEAEAYAAELEAKLAKAVRFAELAELVERCGHGVLWDLALDHLAELKGEKDE